MRYPINEGLIKYMSAFHIRITEPSARRYFIFRVNLLCRSDVFEVTSVNVTSTGKRVKMTVAIERVKMTDLVSFFA